MHTSLFSSNKVIGQGAPTLPQSQTRGTLAGGYRGGSEQGTGGSTVGVQGLPEGKVSACLPPGGCSLPNTQSCLPQQVSVAWVKSCICQ